MPTVRYTTGWATERDSAVEGETRTVSGSEAQRLVADGLAEVVRDVPPESPESAAAGPGLEQAASRRRTRQRGERAADG